MRTDAQFDLFALHQWETDGGPAFDDPEDFSTALAEENRAEIAVVAVAPSANGCPIHRDHNTPKHEVRS